MGDKIYVEVSSAHLFSVSGFRLRFYHLRWLYLYRSFNYGDWWRIQYL